MLGRHGQDRRDSETLSFAFSQRKWMAVCHFLKIERIPARLEPASQFPLQKGPDGASRTLLLHSLWNRISGDPGSEIHNLHTLTSFLWFLPAVSAPFIYTLPPEGFRRLLKCLTKVVFPAPFCPIRGHKTHLFQSPGWTPRTAVMLP